MKEAATDLDLAKAKGPPKTGPAPAAGGYCRRHSLQKMGINRASEVISAVKPIGNGTKWSKTRHDLVLFCYFFVVFCLVFGYNKPVVGVLLNSEEAVDV